MLPSLSPTEALVFSALAASIVFCAVGAVSFYLVRRDAKARATLLQSEDMTESFAIAADVATAANQPADAGLKTVLAVAVSLARRRDGNATFSAVRAILHRDQRLVLAVAKRLRPDAMEAQLRASAAIAVAVLERVRRDTPIGPVFASRSYRVADAAVA